HTAGNRLLVFARKPAPGQVTYLGFPGTTGVSAVDYCLTDAFVDPLDEDGFCAEALVRLPDSAWCYAPLSGSPDVAALPALENGFVTFGSFNRLAKVTSHVLYLWARILQQVDASRLLLKSAAFRDPGPADRMRAFFADHGIEAERIALLPDDVTHLGHLQRYAEVDIALDAFPYQGMATTCEALWMGVPVVSFAGQHHVSRVGRSLLSNAVMPELAATSYDGYVQVAAQLAADLRMLSDLRAGLRQRMRNSVLMDAPRFAGNIETAFRDMWRTWCAQRRT